MCILRLAVLLILGAWLGGAAISVRGAPVAEKFATGAELDERLRGPVTVSWTNTPAARALRSLSDAQHVAIVLDRRIDPDREITLALRDEPLVDGLAKAAREMKGGYCQLGPVAYIGPPEMAARLRTLAALRTDEARSLESSIARELLRLRAFEWGDLAEPRRLLAALAEEAGVEIVDGQHIPHDLWRATRLPPLAWIDRVTLLAAQFDMTFTLEQGGRRVRLVPIPNHVALVRTYRAPGKAQALARQWAAALPDARVSAERDQVRLEGRLEDHELAAAGLRGKPARRTTLVPRPEVYQLSVENAALDQVVEQLATRLGLTVEWDRAALRRAGIASDQLISVKVKDATLDELWQAVLKGTKLAYRRNDRAVSIFPAAE
jgi:hypothetical protein